VVLPVVFFWLAPCHVLVITSIITTELMIGYATPADRHGDPPPPAAIPNRKPSKDSEVQTFAQFFESHHVKMQLKRRKVRRTLLDTKLFITCSVLGVMSKSPGPFSLFDSAEPGSRTLKLPDLYLNCDNSNRLSELRF